MFRLALCQIKGSFEKEKAMERAAAFVRRAAKAGAQVVSLPEMWNCPYSNQYFRDYAEPADGPSVQFLRQLARDFSICLIGGSIPELDGGRVYNTCFVCGSDGAVLAKHRKVHLFDIDIRGGVRFKESETLSPGDSATVFDTEFGRLGVAICYDVRFPRLFETMADNGAQLIVLPGAFNMTTGPAHWDLLMRARAVDCQIYFAACSPARDLSGPYQAYGHSCIVNPFGEFCGKTDSRESIVSADIDFDYLAEIRQQIPVTVQRRDEVYRQANPI